MVGEKDVIKLLKDNFSNFMESIDKYGLSVSGKRNLLLELQNVLSNTIVNELNNNKINNPKKEISIEENNKDEIIQFTPEEEEFIRDTVKDLDEKGEENLRFKTMPPLTDRDLANLREAYRIYNESKKMGK